MPAWSGAGAESGRRLSPRAVQRPQTVRLSPWGRPRGTRGAATARPRRRAGIEGEGEHAKAFWSPVRIRIDAYGRLEPSAGLNRPTGALVGGGLALREVVAVGHGTIPTRHRGAAEHRRLRRVRVSLVRRRSARPLGVGVGRGSEGGGWRRQWRRRVLPPVAGQPPSLPPGCFAHPPSHFCSSRPPAGSPAPNRPHPLLGFGLPYASELRRTGDQNGHPGSIATRSTTKISGSFGPISGGLPWLP